MQSVLYLVRSRRPRIAPGVPPSIEAFDVYMPLKFADNIKKGTVYSPQKNYTIKGKSVCRRLLKGKKTRRLSCWSDQSGGIDSLPYTTSVWSRGGESGELSGRGECDGRRSRACVSLPRQRHVPAPVCVRRVNHARLFEVTAYYIYILIITSSTNIKQSILKKMHYICAIAV